MECIIRLDEKSNWCTAGSSKREPQEPRSPIRWPTKPEASGPQDFGYIETHKTNDADFAEITIVEALNSLKKEIGPKVSFSVLSDKSALRKIMPHKQF